MYADDTSLLVNGNYLHSLIASLNNALKDLCTWFKSHKLSLKANKTFYMIFHRSRIKCNNDSTRDIIMDNSILRKPSSLKYLGEIVDQKLNWIEHISYVKNKISKGIGIMYKARRHLDKKVCLAYITHIYNVCPYLTYCIEVWGCAAKSHIQSLFLLRKKIVRIMTFSSCLEHSAV